MHRVLSLIGAGIVATAVQATAQPAATLTRTRPPAAVGTPASASARVSLTAIQGNTLTEMSGPLPNASVRLRDVRSGRIVDVTTSDKAGLFVFRRVDPGSYVVELVGNDQRVLAASQLLNINAGELLSTMV